MSGVAEVIGWIIVGCICGAALICLAALYVYLLMAMEIPWLIADAARWAWSVLRGHRSTEG